MNFLKNLCLKLCLCGLLPGTFSAPAMANPGETERAYATGRYPDLFEELLGKPGDEVTRKVTDAFRQLFHGNDSTERVYYPVGDDMGYIEDILHNDVRTEGMSYGMMIAVQLDKRDEFDRLWKWAKTHMQHRSGPRAGYFAWHCTPHGAMIDSNAASDGEEWFVTALLFASARWGEGEGIRAYSNEANAILHAMLGKDTVSDRRDVVTSMFNRREHQVVFVPVGNADDFTDPSYHLPHFYELWGRWADRDNAFWCTAARTSRTFLKAAAHPHTGLMPDYAHFDGTPANPWNNGSNDFRYDAWRVAMNVAVDHVWFNATPWTTDWSNRLLGFFASQGIGTYGNLYSLDGRQLSADHSAGLVAMNAVAALAASTNERAAFVRELWDLPVPRGAGRYYDGLLYMLGLLQVSGNFRIYDPTGTIITDCGAE